MKLLACTLLGLSISISAWSASEMNLSQGVAAAFSHLQAPQQTVSIDAVCSGGYHRSTMTYGEGWSDWGRALAAVAIGNAIGAHAQAASDRCDDGGSAAFVHADFVTTAHGLLMEPRTAPAVLHSDAMDLALRNLLKP